MVLATLMKIYTSFIGHHIVASHTWISPNVRGDGPDAREGHSAALVGKRLFIFGGCGKSSDNSHEIYYNDLYILNTGNFLHIWLVSKYLFWSCFSFAYNLCIHQVPMLYRTTKDYFLFFIFLRPCGGGFRGWVMGDWVDFSKTYWLFRLFWWALKVDKSSFILENYYSLAICCAQPCRVKDIVSFIFLLLL